MKNIDKNNFFQHKSFYFALYSCVIAIAILATINTYTSLESPKSKQKENISLTTSKSKIDGVDSNLNTNKTDTQQNSSQESKSTQEYKPVLSNKTKSYLAPEDKPTNDSVRDYENSNPMEKITATQPKNAREPNRENPYILETSNTLSQQNNMSLKANIDLHQTLNNETDQDDKNILEADQDSQQTFILFDETQKMDWPLLGKIIMDYDKENLVYDKTLEQYRTNDSLSLEAKVGDQVKASADGIVKLITKTEENGNTIVIDHGNDWESIYSQLQDNILVNEGDIVKKGQVIGGVNSPTRYGILLGSHLNFKITHENSAVNPKTVLVSR